MAPPDDLFHQGIRNVVASNGCEITYIITYISHATKTHILGQKRTYLSLTISLTPPLHLKHITSHVLQPPPRFIGASLTLIISLEESAATPYPAPPSRQEQNSSRQKKPATKRQNSPSIAKITPVCPIFHRPSARGTLSHT